MLQFNLFFMKVTFLLQLIFNSDFLYFLISKLFLTWCLIYSFKIYLENCIYLFQNI